MTIKNRTTEFQAVVRTIRNRESPTPPSSLNSRNTSRASTPNKNFKKSEFSRQASAISNKIQQTATKLQKLTKLAKKRSLFDDKPTEVNELTFAIKQDIAGINQQLSTLQQYTKNQNNSSGKGQQEEHISNVVTNLQSQLANTSISFKDVLEIRSENMKVTRQRKEQFTYQAASYKNEQSKQIYIPYFNNGYIPEANGGNKEYLALDLGDPALQQMQLIEQQDSYIDSRASAITNIESTIAELGSVFQQLANMVAEQRDVVQRIDANVESMELNVTGAQQELLRYYTSISSNRWLIIKVFGLIVMFMVLFVTLR
ncbi:t-SNARE [Neoconidiobolus thromboides FSU 785]|nr:t-SNARE [Neoconidiobolus thromboides FSU 785]